jgi:hypothetical protein
MPEIAKITLLEKPEKSESGKARLFKVKDQGDYWIPETYFFGYNPATKQAEVETWILHQKGIKYKV